MSKPKNPANNYWSEEVIAKYIVEYQRLMSQDCVGEANDVYLTYIHTPLLKLVENCAHLKSFTYALQQYGDEDLQKLLLSHASELLPKVDLSKGKAFSFISLCLKRYAIHLNMNGYNEILKNDSIQKLGESSGGDKSEINEDKLDFLQTTDSIHNFNYKEFMIEFANHIDKNRKLVVSKQRVSAKRDNDVIEVLIEILRNPQEYEMGKKTTNVKKPTGYGKNSFTSLVTNKTGHRPEVTRNVIKRIKKEYEQFKKLYFE